MEENSSNNNSETTDQVIAASPIVQPPTPSSVDSIGKMSTANIFALILSIFSLTCCGFFTGIPAIFLARAEMNKATQGIIAPANRVAGKIAMVIGIIGTSLSLLGAISYVLILAIGLSFSMM